MGFGLKVSRLKAYEGFIQGCWVSEASQRSCMWTCTQNFWRWRWSLKDACCLGNYETITVDIYFSESSGEVTKGQVSALRNSYTIAAERTHRTSGIHIVSKKSHR